MDFARWSLPFRRAAFAAVALLLAAQPLRAQQLPQAPDPMIPARTLGNPLAAVTVYEMSDFQCPWCRRHVMETWPALQRDYVNTGRVRWIFINFPIPQLHPNAEAAAEFAMCSAKAGGFWKIHDLLYQYQDKWAPLKDPAPFLLSLADSARLPKKAIQDCLASGSMKDIVKADAEGAARVASSTPTFYIDGGVLPGFHPIEQWKPLLDSILASKRK
ncbi:MAG TPA: thioredoxin domain-containing protein [Gemmatimonadales bacterium]|nr:thioredoxin domain-containing protein [Gemmatimonadales bacterium]